MVVVGALAFSTKVPIFQMYNSIIFGAFFNEIYHSFQRSKKLCLDYNLIQSE